MGAREYWDRMLVYFGITDEPEAAAAAREAGSDDEWGGDPVRPARRRAPVPPGEGDQVAGGVAVMQPRTFNDAQTIADRFKVGTPVIVNLQSTDADVARQVINFVSGLTYGLDGAMQRIAERVFLLTPYDVEVSDEDRTAMVESGFFS